MIHQKGTSNQCLNCSESNSELSVTDNHINKMHEESNQWWENKIIKKESAANDCQFLELERSAAIDCQYVNLRKFYKVRKVIGKKVILIYYSPVLFRSSYRKDVKIKIVKKRDF